MRVVALGNPERGDDGVGPRVLERLRARVPGLEALSLRDTSMLIEVLDGQPTLLIDALLHEGPPGALLEPAPTQLAQLRSLSSHGLGLREALGVAEALHGPTPLHILGIAVQGAAEAPGLSPEVEAALPRAVERALALIEAPPEPPAG